MFTININSDAAVHFTNKLEKLNRSAFPVAVRGVLNDSVFDVKTDTMPREAGSTFEHRSKNFFTANSKFIKAEGFDIKTMEASVGFYENKLKNQSTNFAVKDLEQQELGGEIKKKSFIPLINARSGRNFKRVVRANARLSQIKKIVNSKNVPAVNSKQAFRKAVALAGKGGFVLGNRNPGILWEVLSLNRVEGGAFKLAPIYSFKQGRTVKVLATHFMKDASVDTSLKMDRYYVNQALRQFKKAGVIR